MQQSALSQFANLRQPSLAKALGSAPRKIYGRHRAADFNPRGASNPPPDSDHDTREILPPGKLHREDSDSAITGITRSLQRRLLGLREFAKRRSMPPATQIPDRKKLD